MARCNKVIKMIEIAKRNRNCQYHRKAGIERSGNEIGRENGRVPARGNADGKVHTDDTVNGDDQWRRQGSQEKIESLVPDPMPCIPTPAHGEQAVKYLRYGSRGAITQGC